MYCGIQMLEKSLCDPTYSLTAVWSAVFQRLLLDITLKQWQCILGMHGVNPECVYLEWCQP